MMLKIRILWTCFFCFSMTAFSQQARYFTSDSLIHYHIRNSGDLQGAFFLDNHFYCYGDTSFNGIPTMFVKLDTAGNTVWSADNRNQLPSSPPTSEQTRQFPYFNSVI